MRFGQVEYRRGEERDFFLFFYLYAEFDFVLFSLLERSHDPDLQQRFWNTEVTVSAPGSLANHREILT